MGQKRAAYDASGSIVAFYDDAISPAPSGATTIALTDVQWKACVSDQRYKVVGGSLVAPAVTPAPTDAELLAAAQAAQLAVLTASCAAAIVAGFSSLALGSAHTYPSKLTDQQNLASSVLDSVMAKTSPGWGPSTQYDAGTICLSSAGVPYKCVSAGTSGTQLPSWPVVPGSIINDGTAQWQLWTTPFWCADASGNWSWTDHSADQIQAVGRDIKASILVCQAKNAALAAKVSSIALDAYKDVAAAIAAVQAVVWA